MPERLPLLVTECLSAHRAQDWDRLRRLVHPQARIGVFATGGHAVDVERAIDAMRTAHEDVSYSAEVQSMVGLDAHAVVLEGGVGHRAADGRYVYERHAWLYVFVDDLLYRSAMFGSADEAKAAYRERGIDLGVGDRGAE